MPIAPFQTLFPNIETNSLFYSLKVYIGAFSNKAWSVKNISKIMGEII